MEANEAKIKAIIGKDIAPLNVNETSLIKGNIGPINLKDDNAIVLFDKSLADENNLVCGANKEEYHISGLCIKRDLPNIVYYDITKVKEKQLCSCCGKGHLNIYRGVEIGNIFQLETKYSKPMKMTVHMPDGSEINPLMGCYGIGIGRNLACIAEESSDDKGLVWNMNVAPWEVILCPLRLDDENVLNKTNALYDELKNVGIDVLYDDRNISAGIKFADSELIGIPVRIVISPRSLLENNVEVTIRETGEKLMIKYEDIVSYIKKYVNDMKF